MTSYEKPTERPEIGVFHAFDHVTFWVGNAKQAASFYTTRFGFDFVAYKGLETGNRDVCSHVIRQGGIYFVFQSPLNPGNEVMGAHQTAHGDGVRDVAFTVDNARGIYEKAVARGAKSVSEPEELTDENGTVVVASVMTYGDTIHTFVQRDGYTGCFLPGYKTHHSSEIFNKFMKRPNLLKIDHCVGNQPENDMEPTAAWYEKMLDFHRFWSVDDTQMHTDFSALRSIVMTDFDEAIKMPINEPAVGKRKSQIQEYVEYYSGAGVQHIALRVDNIIESIEALRSRGVDFLIVPESYYDNLEKRLANSPVQITEDLKVLRKLGILVDYDDKGYLLQLFSKPVEDRPTLFIEIIQRKNHQGFGAGNFKALFEAIELEQAKRGNL